MARSTSLHWAVDFKSLVRVRVSREALRKRAATVYSRLSVIRTEIRGFCQQVTTRLPGRIDSNASSFASVRDLADAMTRASRAHADHEKRIGEADPNWPDWYASYMVAEQSGHELPL